MIFELTDMQKIGAGLTCFGVTYIMLGMALFFDKGLLAIGNLFFIIGLALLFGVQRASRFFLQWQRLRGSTLFFSGIAIVLAGWPIVGVAIECVGFLLVFGAFIPAAVNVLRGLPVVGTILCFPGVKQIMEYIAPQTASAS